MNPSEMSGLELVQAMVEGKLAHPSMADTIPMRATEAARGHVTFTVRADNGAPARPLTATDRVGQHRLAKLLSR